MSLLLVAACGAFVASEFALVTVERQSVERAVAGGDVRAGRVLIALRGLSTQLSSAQVGITVTNLAIGFLAEPAVAALIEGPLTSSGVPERAVPGVAVAVAITLATAVTMVYGELVPKNLAIARPMATARAVVGFQLGFTRAAGWPVRFLNGTANALLRLFGVEPQEELASARSPQELASLVQRSADKGTLPVETAALLRRTLRFGALHAVDVMTPRVRIRTLQEHAPVSAVLLLARATGHSRFPVQGRDSDDIVGVVHIKHAVTVREQDRDRVIVGSVMVEPVVVPSTLHLDPLLSTLRAGGLQLAVVVDEFGGVDGIVTIEDLIEELIGEVEDEHDRPPPQARRDADGRWVLSGLLRPDEAFEITKASLPADEHYETLGGMVAYLLGRIPRVGDQVEVNGLKLSVERMDGRRVDRVLLSPAPASGGHAHE
ncbi:MAG: hemolysin family protein [Mycobacteriales bacterium]